MTTLLDANPLIALVVPDHVHHGTAIAWWSTHPHVFATCPSTQASLVRSLLREGRSGAVVHRPLRGTANHPRHGFWADSVRCDETPLERVTGHRRVAESDLVGVGCRRSQATLSAS